MKKVQMTVCVEMDDGFRDFVGDPITEADLAELGGVDDSDGEIWRTSVAAMREVIAAFKEECSTVTIEQGDIEFTFDCERVVYIAFREWEE